MRCRLNGCTRMLRLLPVYLMVNASDARNPHCCISGTGKIESPPLIVTPSSMMVGHDVIGARSTWCGPNPFDDIRRSHRTKVSSWLSVFWFSGERDITIDHRWSDVLAQTRVSARKRRQQQLQRAFEYVVSLESHHKHQPAITSELWDRPTSPEEPKAFGVLALS